MIKRLQRRFFLIAAVSLLAVELIIIGLINIINYTQINGEETQLISAIVNNNGKFPDYKSRSKTEDVPPPTNGKNAPRNYKDFNIETGYQTRYFTVSRNSSGDVDRVDTGHIAAVDSQDAIMFAEQADEEGKDNGYIGNYRYSVSDKDNGGKMYVFLDCTKNFDTKRRFLLLSVSIAAAGYAVVCILILMLSKRAVKPFIESLEKQRRFITDAGHEIKTPLAIISANAEVIEMTSEPSEWTQSIKNQIERLSGLTANLLKLSKMEEDKVSVTFCDFDISQAVSDTAEQFEALCETKGRNLKISVDESLTFFGDEASVRQLVSILTENAVKYSDEGGIVRIDLYKSANGKSLKLKVTNTCSEPPQGDLNRLFDRFYRADESRSRNGEDKGGYGIGLSVAKAICEAHKGRISCKAEKGEICFTAVFKI